MIAVDKTLSKGIAVLEFLVSTRRTCGVSELADHLSLTKSNVHRLLQTLVRCGYVQKCPEGRYRPSLKLWELGAQLVAGLDVKQVAADQLRMLADKTQETVHLSVLDGWDVIYIDKIESSHPVRAASRVGGRAPAYCSSTGKAMLAFSDQDFIATTNVFTRKTKRTLVTLAALRKELQIIRRDGFATNRGEMTDSVWGIAAPIFDSGESVIAAVGVAGPTERMDSARLRTLAPLVISAARSISEGLGYFAQRDK